MSRPGFPIMAHTQYSNGASKPQLAFTNAMEHPLHGMPAAAKQQPPPEQQESSEAAPGSVSSEGTYSP